MDIQQMMKQAQAMQQRMEDMQGKLGDMLVEGQSGGGMVKVTMTCKGELKKVDIDTIVVDPEDKETLEDLVIAAVNQARENADGKMAEETRKMMDELGLPAGTQLPGM